MCGLDSEINLVIGDLRDLQYPKKAFDAAKPEIAIPMAVQPIVMEPIAAYLMIAQAQYGDKKKYEGNYNVGPDETVYWATGDLVTLFCDWVF